MSYFIALPRDNFVFSGKGYLPAAKKIYWASIRLSVSLSLIRNLQRMEVQRDRLMSDSLNWFILIVRCAAAVIDQDDALTPEHSIPN